MDPIGSLAAAAMQLAAGEPAAGAGEGDKPEGGDKPGDDPAGDKDEGGDESDESSKHLAMNLGIIVILSLLILYNLFEACKHKQGIVFGHEASLVTLVGLLVSGTAFALNKPEFNQFMQFDDNLFFYFVLPPIVFASGFNMYRKRFFQNIRNILLFGVLSTFISFAIFSTFTILAFEYIPVKQLIYDEATNDWKSTPLKLDTMEILLMSSLLCSSDVIAAVSLLKPTEQPKLFSLVFGEGIVNDAVSIILFNTVMKFTKEQKEFNSGSVALISVDFLNLGFYSMLIGLAAGLICATTLKHCRSMTKSPVVECVMVFCFAYVSYISAEMIHQSGIISLLTAGVIMAHYAWYNMSPQGKTSSAVVFQFLGFIAEGFIFSYLGLTFFSYRTMPWSYEFVGIELVIIIVGRLLATMGLVGLLKLCGYERDHPSPLTFKELLFCWYAGLIRGAIAFGLVLRIDSSVANRSVIVTTSLCLVVATTIFFGSTVGLLGCCLFRKPEEDVEDDKAPAELAQSLNSSLSQIQEGLNHPNEELAGQSVRDNFIRAVEHHDDVYDKNAQGGEASGDKKRRRARKHGGCIKYLRIFDEEVMKPLFIHQYEKERIKQVDKLMEILQERGQGLDTLFKEGQFDNDQLAEFRSKNGIN